MQPTQVLLKIQPCARGEDTELSISGALDTVLGSEFMHSLLRLLSAWSGRPVCVVFPVDYDLPDWFELWAEVLGEAHKGDVEIQFVLDAASREPSSEVGS